MDAALKTLTDDLKALARQLDAIHKAYDGQPLIASHPVYQYLAARHKWSLHSMHWEPEEIPDEKAWQEFDQLREKHKATLMIWEGPPDQAIRDQLTKRGVQVVVFSPCGNRPEQGDYLSVMKENIANLDAALNPAKP